MKRFKNGKYMTLLAILLISFTLVACGDGGSSKIVGKVGDVNITEGELSETLIEMYGEDTLNQMISDKMIDQEIKKANIKIKPEDVDKEIEIVAENYNGIEGLNNAITQSGMTLDDYKKGIERNLSIEALLGDDIKVNNDEIKTYYDENKESFFENENVNADHILVEDEDTAKEIKKKLDAGEDFKELAKEFSIDGSSENGGKLGKFYRGDMVKEFEDVTFKLKVNEISDPVKTEYGYHIIKLNEKKDGRQATLDESRDEIIKTIKGERVPEVFREWHDDKLKEYDTLNSLSKAENQINEPEQ